MTREEELALIDRVRRGERQAFEPLVLENQGRVYAIALRMMGNETDAADAAQEAFLRAYAAIGSFRGDSRFSTWLSRLTGNICIDLLRERKRAQVISLSRWDDEDARAEYDIPDERFLPENEAEKKELRQAVYRAMDALPEEYRQILALREMSGLSYEELGQKLHLEPGTVKSRLSRARRKMCELLAADGNFSRPAASKNTEGGERRD